MVSVRVSSNGARGRLLTTNEAYESHEVIAEFSST